MRVGKPVFPEGPQPECVGDKCVERPSKERTKLCKDTSSIEGRPPRPAPSRGSSIRKIAESLPWLSSSGATRLPTAPLSILSIFIGGYPPSEIRSAPPGPALSGLTPPRTPTFFPRRLLPATADGPALFPEQGLRHFFGRKHPLRRSVHPQRCHFPRIKIPSAFRRSVATFRARSKPARFLAKRCGPCFIAASLRANFFRGAISAVPS